MAASFPRLSTVAVIITSSPIRTELFEKTMLVGAIARSGAGVRVSTMEAWLFVSAISGTALSASAVTRTAYAPVLFVVSKTPSTVADPPAGSVAMICVAPTGMISCVGDSATIATGTSVPATVPTFLTVARIITGSPLFGWSGETMISVAAIAKSGFNGAIGSTAAA